VLERVVWEKMRVVLMGEFLRVSFFGCRVLLSFATYVLHNVWFALLFS
jgi:hypothetical protein